MLSWLLPICKIFIIIIDMKKNKPSRVITSCHTFLLLYILIMTGCKVNQDANDHQKDIIGTLKSKSSSEIAGSYWGIQAGTLEDSLLDKAAEIGVKWTRLGASWPSIEKEKGVFDWSETDVAFIKIFDKGITPFVTLGSGNKLYTELSTYDDPKLAEIYGYRPGPPTQNPEALEAWLRFVGATVERYRDIIKYWEIWNEPNHRNYWGAPPDGKSYGRLLNVTATLIKEIDPEAIIIGGSMAGIEPGFTEDFLSAGTADLIDIISYHNYGAIPEERIYKAVELWEVIDRYNADIQLWQGECGYPSHSSTRDYRGISPWGLNIQSKWLLRQAFTDVFFCKATLSNYFKLVHLGGRGTVKERSMLSPVDSILGFPERGGSRVRTWGVNEKCLLANPDLKPKPAYFTYQNLCSVLDDSYRIKKIAYEIQVLDQGMFYGIGPEDDAFPSVPLVAGFVTEEEQYLLAYWLPWHPQEYTPDPATINLVVKYCRFEKPVRIDLITGTVHEIKDVEMKPNEIIFKGIPLSDYPFIIAELNEINLK
jgi:hypothetical protein